MKQSKYNFFYDFPEQDEKKLAYNALTNSLALMDYEHYTQYNNFVSDNIAIDDEKFVDDLKMGGYIIEDEMDELKLLELQLFQNRFNRSVLGLTIAVTADCNFRCTYCYEKNSIENTKMNQDVQDNIIQLIKDQANGLKVLAVTWYGGEPLLMINVIRDLSERIQKICEERQITYFAYMVTNGYLLTREIALDLKDKLNIQGMQITLDGPEDIHNKRRPLAGGQGTFQKILNNLKENIDVLPSVSIRINTDIDNQDRISEVFQVLKDNDLADKVNVYLGHVEALNDGYVTCKCLTPEGFSQAYYDFMKENKLDIKKLYPKRFTNYCGADALNSFVVGADGNLYKCWNDIGIQEKLIGKLPMEGTVDNFKLYSDYLLYDPTKDERCTECKLLPVCMGGCPNRRLLGVENCNHTKYVLEEYLQACAHSIIEERMG